LNTQQLSVRLVAEAASIAEARRFVHDALSVWSVDSTFADTVALLASELVTNAVLHAEPPIDLTLDWDDPRLRVEVSDGGNQMPEVITPLPPAGRGGYGLRLVEDLARAWGASRRSPHGKIVWFDIELEPTQS
jgi:anti-sigma regulatory factor (Ser/Thr protein kinase)